MFHVFDIFRGGVIIEVGNTKESAIAEASGAVALLLAAEESPIAPDGNDVSMKEILNSSHIPLLTSFRPGHKVEAEILYNIGAWGLYEDSRYEPLLLNSQEIHSEYPCLSDVVTLEGVETNTPVVLRGDSLEFLSEELAKKEDGQYVFVSGPIETVSDIAFLKRAGADVIILSRSVFDYADSRTYIPRLIEASFYYDNPQKLSTLFRAEVPEEGVK
ncbi:hypothetical protein COB57_04350 [Candidatus Peregrinibacteria bacterium]|nr:MAG: hypothetical protein COB57_04350 [Candidatus Peregrinibacteria bacterium]